MKKNVLVTALFIALALTGCSGQEVSRENVTEEVIAEASDFTNEEDSAIVESAESTSIEETTPIEIEETQPSTSIMEEKLELAITENNRVAELLNETGTYTDSVGNTCRYTYQIPQFNAESESARALNFKIVQEFSEDIGHSYESMESGDSLACCSVTYEVYEYGDVVSFLVSISYGMDYDFHEAYSYDFGQDKEMTNKDLLELNEMTEEMFVEEACRRAREEFTDTYPNMPKEERDMLIAESEESTTVDLPMYFDSDGTLNAYVPVVSPAGPSWIYTLYQF